MQQPGHVFGVVTVQRAGGVILDRAFQTFEQVLVINDIAVELVVAVQPVHPADGLEQAVVAEKFTGGNFPGTVGSILLGVDGGFVADTAGFSPLLAGQVGADIQVGEVPEEHRITNLHVHICQSSSCNPGMRLNSRVL